MPTNDFVPFCPTDTGTNLLEQSDYLASPYLPIGNQPGVASSKLNNKVLRQASFIASQVAQLAANVSGLSINDDANAPKFLGILSASLLPLPRGLTSLLSGSGFYNPDMYFFVASANATSGAVYTNNSQTFTVIDTIAGGSLLHCSMTGAPALSGTLTKTSGTGDSSISFFAARLPIQVNIKMVGGGGGGGAIDPGSGVTSGSDGTATSFNSIVAAFGKGASSSGNLNGGAGGSAGAGTANRRQPGKSGGSGGTTSPGTSGTAYGAPGANYGGDTPLGYGGGTVGILVTGSNPGTGYGSGGSGGGIGNNYQAPGGGGGEYVELTIPNPSSNYAYAVGAGGNGGTATQNGGNGAGGAIFAETVFQ